ncbi:gluconate:H+ symporter [Staphylococcus succinus]|uniref:Gluconate permease n=1 Tax=Staphylococcus succinus TaxID=61015 RepID=A0ABX5IMH1_9STAP|nr:gluconate:H+ symporter [Staphylococcus succinus]PTI69142.1 gluconate permease [Staphylococcus succinus]RIN36312.1 gluconate permease [Staphylococcus succinus]
MPLIITGIGILILLLLIMKFKINTFLSLIIVSFILALLLQIPPDKIAGSIEKGLGDTLGHIGLIFGLGAMLGKLISNAGGSHRIAVTLINKFGKKKIQWAVVVASFIVGITLFYEVAFILLVPIVFTIAKEINISILKLGFPMVATLLVTHSFLPPHPGATAVTLEYGAEVGTVLIIGIIIAIPTVIVGGIFYPKILNKRNPMIFKKPRSIYPMENDKVPKNTPGFAISVLTAIFPVILMAFGAITIAIKDMVGMNNNLFFEFIAFISNASVAILISLLLAIYTMGIRRKIPISNLMDICISGINTLGFLFLVIGGGGAIKQVLLDGGVGDYIAQIFEGSTINPIILAWFIAALLRISLGSGTVATLSTAGLVIPILNQTPDVNLALVTLATGAGSCILSHVNDAMFWMIKEYMGMTLKETFATYTVISTIISVTGLILVLILDVFI